MKFHELQALALRKLQVKNLTPKATNPFPNKHQLYTMPSLRVGRSAQIVSVNLLYILMY